MNEIKYLAESQAIDLMNKYGREEKPFLFIIDFDKLKSIVVQLEDLYPDQIQFTTPQKSNSVQKNNRSRELKFQKYPVSFAVFDEAFKKVQKEIHYGNSFLLNLAFKTKIDLNRDLEEIYHSANARYKLYVKDKFVCFSPESFVTIKNGKIYSYPMKGTIDATLPDAHNIIMEDAKEKAEHYTIVDLIRNDLGMVANNIQVEKFRYIEKIRTNFGELIQVSSKISGELPSYFNENIGNIIFRLLPAGSVTGAPKARTVSIINAIEDFDRNYYTGIFGVFDGKDLDSGVMIRYIEQEEDGLFFKSGGGITFMSNAKSEYEEMIKKVYVPIT